MEPVTGRRSQLTAKETLLIDRAQATHHSGFGSEIKLESRLSDALENVEECCGALESIGDHWKALKSTGERLYSKRPTGSHSLPRE